MTTEMLSAARGGRVLGLAATIALAVMWPPSAQAGTVTYGPTLHNNGGAGYGHGTVGSFVVPQFDDLGGSLTLTGVTLTVAIDSTGGKHEFDNEWSSGATITLGIGSSVRVKGPLPPIGAQLIVSPDATETLTGFVTADTDDFPDFLGTDSLGITGVFATDTKVGSKTAALDLVPYIGTGNASFDFDGGLSTFGTSALTPSGAVRTTYATTNFNFTTTVQYAFVPEPSTLVLLGAGAITLIAYAWRRRKRTA